MTIQHPDMFVALFVSLVGLIFSVRNFYASYSDYAFLRRMRINGARRLIAWSSSRSEIIRLMQQGILAYAITLVIFSPMPHVASMDIVITAITSLITAQSITRNRDRHHVLMILEDEHRSTHGS